MAGHRDAFPVGIILRETTLDEAVSGGDVQLTGDQAKLTEVVSYLDTFPFWFNIVTP
ncbi:alkyl sulfatase C-terminal domain-containing protein [Amaricoccus sp.]|uniref:alkyl sulfatase C-terminal domain-containing protein n=1 Tax=Amaricoccus sp. TaxID=1872485 RepID=UPI002612F098|nr:alkyl sulfatase C-terminal domain-containing protein [Amaricoccus sp.]HRO10995.1 alkyl sulfatase C-terminal domain-containing protein [Amaricoccus sp.]